jgi:DNA-binding response OmpR family regulator
MEQVLLIEDDDRIRLSLTLGLEDEGYAVRGRVLSRARLLERVWEYAYGDERLVDVYIGRIRQKIEADPAAPRHLVTVRGMGYKLPR